MAEPETSSLPEGEEQSLPSSAESEDSSEMGDLFRLLKRKAPEEEVLKLVDAASAKEKTESDGGLPLHWALEHKASHAVFEALLAAHPDAVKVKDNEGFLPLHNAVEWQASEEIFNELLEAYPDAVKVKENNGNLPIHLALRREASDAIVAALLEAHPGAVKEKNDEGELPLHMAAWYKASDAAIAALLGAADALTTNTPRPPQRRARPRAAPITIGNGLPSISSITAMDDDERENINSAEVGMFQHLSISTASHPATFELLSDEILGKIMAHSSFAAGGFETSSPAGRFACVSRRWNLVYRAHKEDFATNELRRVDDDIAITSEGPHGSGTERTIVDSWLPLGPQQEPDLPCWWTGGHFEGGAWSEEVIPIDAEAGPFPAIQAPTLVLRFERKVVVRAIGVWARNKPRRVTCFVRRGSMDVESGQNTFAIGQGTNELSFNPVFHRAVYDRLVAAKMPQGRPATAMTPNEAIQSQLPELLPEPLTIDEGEGFCIKIMASQEREWVGINHLTIWE